MCDETSIKEGAYNELEELEHEVRKICNLVQANNKEDKNKNLTISGDSAVEDSEPAGNPPAIPYKDRKRTCFKVRRGLKRVKFEITNIYGDSDDTTTISDVIIFDAEASKQNKDSQGEKNYTGDKSRAENELSPSRSLNKSPLEVKDNEPSEGKPFDLTVLIESDKNDSEKNFSSESFGVSGKSIRGKSKNKAAFVPNVTRPIPSCSTQNYRASNKINREPPANKILITNEHLTKQMIKLSDEIDKIDRVIMNELKMKDSYREQGLEITRTILDVLDKKK